MTFRVISIDSHPVSGTIVFSVGTGPQPSREARAPQRDPAVLATLIATRGLFLAMLLLAAGGILALWRVAHFSADLAHAQRRVVSLAALGALVVTPVLLGVVGCHLAGTSLAGFADRQPGASPSRRP